MRGHWRETESSGPCLFAIICINQKGGCQSVDCGYNPQHRLQPWAIPGRVPDARSMTAENTYQPSLLEELRDELPIIWKNIPHKGVFVSLLAAWVLLFEFLGNSTFGYIQTHSLFAWTF